MPAPEAPARAQLSAGLRVQGAAERTLPGGHGPHGLRGLVASFVVVRWGQAQLLQALPSNERGQNAQILDPPTRVWKRYERFA